MTDAPQRLTTALGERYLIERELGAGGMATVYLAKDLKHDREVALKVLRPELGAVLGSERFLAEIKITARLDHPHILTLIDSGASDGFLYYVLPYVRGESLRDKLNREQQLGLDEALQITKQVASALDYAHRHGVVHRDIKPENILLQEGEAMLADFGIALAVSEAGGNRLTETGLSLGTPQYMSPEQATGGRALDARSDVYSLGAVLYEMLAGEPPVTGPTAQAMIAKLMTERPTRLRVVRQSVPEAVDSAVAKALDKTPADRFPSAAQFAAALEGGRADGRVGGRNSLAALRRQAVARPVLFAALAVIVLGVAVVAAVVWRGRAGPAVVLDRVQLTFTGNATTAALSADGQRVAYVARACAESGTCTYDLVVQDVGGAGTAVLARGFASLWRIQWTRDGRWLLIHASFGAGRWGLFSVPSLGGTPRHLGCCGGALIAGGDTALMDRGGGAADSLLWLRRVTIADGVVHDSVGIRWPAALGASGRVLANGRHVVLDIIERVGWVLVTADRAGRIVDSLRIGMEDDFDVIGIADGLVAAQGVSGRPSEVALVRYGIDGAGRFARRPDTLLAALPRRGGNPSIGANGQLVLTDGAAEYSIWALQRRATTSTRFDLRRLAVATAPLSGSIAPGGTRVLVVRTVASGDLVVRQMSLMPFDSGPEVPLGAAIRGLEDWEFGAGGTEVYSATMRGADSIALQVWNLATGRPRDVAVFRETDYGGVEALPGGGVVLMDAAGRSIRLVGVPGRRDTTFALPEVAGLVSTVDPSPDGRQLATIGWDFANDSVLVQRIDLTTGHATRLAAFSGEGWDMIRWLPGDMIQFGILETAAGVAWYTMPVRGGRIVRLGSPPRYPASYRLSDDGLRAIARASDPRTDVFIIRNFAELLHRTR